MHVMCDLNQREGSRGREGKRLKGFAFCQSTHLGEMYFKSESIYLESLAGENRWLDEANWGQIDTRKKGNRVNECTCVCVCGVCVCV